MAKQDDWKAKYQDLLRDYEALEGPRPRENALEQLLSGALLGLSGFDADLDQQLKDLRVSLRSQADEKVLSPLVKPLERSVKKLDTQRDFSQRKLLQQLLRWIGQLKSITSHEGTRNLLQALEERSRPGVQSPREFPSLMQELVDLQGGLLSAGLPGAIAGADEPNDLDELLVHDAADQDSATTADDEETEILLKRVAGALLDLIGGLSVPVESREQARVLLRKLEKGISLEQLPLLVSDVVTLVKLSTSNSHEDFENYLLTLTAQLVEVQGFLNESHSDQQEAGERNRALGQKVRSDVTRIHRTVKDSTDLDQLKVSVAQHLAGVVRAMDEFRRQEEEREGRMQERYEALLGKVDQMEAETQRVKAHMEEERLRARTDPLTGLPNRAAYDDMIEQELGRLRRYGNDFSIAVVDIDYFKKINDSYGHLAGDKVLRLIARILNIKSRASDSVSRYGGEEFVVIMPSTEIEAAFQAAENLREEVKGSPFNFRGKRVEVTASFGVTQAQPDDDADSLFQRADEALYRAKQAGRNQTQKSG